MQNVKPTNNSCQFDYNFYVKQYDNNIARFEEGADNMFAQKGCWERNAKIYSYRPLLLTKMTDQQKKEGIEEINDVATRLEGVFKETSNLLARFAHTITSVENDPEEPNKETMLIDLRDKHHILQLISDQMNERLPKAKAAGNAFKKILQDSLPKDPTVEASSVLSNLPFLGRFFVSPPSVVAATNPPQVQQSAQPVSVVVPLAPPPAAPVETKEAIVADAQPSRKPAPPTTPPPSFVAATTSSTTEPAGKKNGSRPSYSAAAAVARKQPPTSDADSKEAINQS